VGVSLLHVNIGPEITFAVVGTAGRKDDAAKLSVKHFEAMCVVATGLIDQFKENNYPITHLVSGGAAWADHVAVKLFLQKKAPHLRLFLPCEWDNGSFKDTGSDDFKTNPGRTANRLHKSFQNRTRINSLTEIQIAKAEGAELIDIAKGFYARNALVAKSDFLLAITYGNGHEVKDGGTAHTVGCYLNRVRKERIFDKSFHYDLTSGNIYVGCKVPPPDPNKEIIKNLSNVIPSLKGSQVIASSFYPP
jgi:hypothetical protein